QNPCTAAYASGPAASASSATTTRMVPNASAMPAARCRIDVTIWICQRYTDRCGDNGLGRDDIDWSMNAVLEATMQRGTACAAPNLEPTPRGAWIDCVRRVMAARGASQGTAARPFLTTEAGRRATVRNPY